jgi:hypothetical protein
MGDGDLKGQIIASRASSDKTLEEIGLSNFQLTERIINGEPCGIVSATLAAKKSISNVTLNFGISNHHGIVVCAWDGAKAGLLISELKTTKAYTVEMSFNKRLLPGKYYVSCIIHEVIGEVSKPHKLYQNFLSFEILGDESMTGIANLNMSVKLNN